MKFPSTVQDIDELIALLQSLDAEDKLYLASQALGCNDDDTDNTGQIVLYTGLMWDKDGEVRPMKEEADDELDL